MKPIPSSPALSSAVQPVNDNSAVKTGGFWSRIGHISAYHWVLVSQLFVILPHAQHLPTWLLVYGVLAILLQFNPIKSRLPKLLTSRRGLQTLQFVGFFASMAGLYFTYRTAIGLDVGVAFLLLCAISKLFELNTRRDAYVILALSLFVLAGLFLMDQSLLTTLQVLLGTFVVLFAMIAQNDDGTGRFRTIGLLILQALPLMVILFLFFPRLPPLWSLKISGNQAKTGMSDSMSPGDIASLSQSTELAFRVEFTGQVPARQNLYWRGLVFDNFDGKTWQSHDKTPTVWFASQRPPAWITQTTRVPTNSQPISYHVIMEKTGQPFLYGLDYPLSNQKGVALTRDFTLRYWTEVAQRFDYQVDWYPKTQIDLVLSEEDRLQNLQLPATGNEESRKFAQDLYQKVGQNPTAYVNAIQQWITTQNFSYTLSPPLLKDNRIDEFLFSTRAGFCEHYSSSFTFLMRTVGIPARVVAGYQGGELGRDGASWEVRQMDAHAWAEIWLDNQGWVRVDPTGFIAPNRVEQGMQQVTAQQGAEIFGEGLAGQISYQQFTMLQEARRIFDQASYYWQRDVVGFDQDNQKNSLLKWFNISSVYQQVLAMVLTFVTVLALFTLWQWWRRRQVWDKADWAIIQLSKRLAKHNKNLARGESEGVLAWLERITPAMQNSDEIDQLKQLYRQYKYAANPHQNPAQLARLAHKVGLTKTT